MLVALDIDTGAVIFVGDGKGGDALDFFRQKLRHSKAKAKAVAMDISPAYVGAVLNHLPKATTVFDHFHVTKFFNNKLCDLRRDLNRMNHKKESTQASPERNPAAPPEKSRKSRYSEKGERMIWRKP